jgi:hypothetical protein
MAPKTQNTPMIKSVAFWLSDAKLVVRHLTRRRGDPDAQISIYRNESHQPWRDPVLYLAAALEKE